MSRGAIELFPQYIPRSSSIFICQVSHRLTVTGLAFRTTPLVLLHWRDRLPDVAQHDPGRLPRELGLLPELNRSAHSHHTSSDLDDQGAEGKELGVRKSKIRPAVM